MQNSKTGLQLAIKLNIKIADALYRVGGFVVSALSILDPVAEPKAINILGGGINTYISASCISLNSAIAGIKTPSVVVFCVRRCREVSSLWGEGSRRCCICGAQ